MRSLLVELIALACAMPFGVSAGETLAPGRPLEGVVGDGAAVFETAALAGFGRAPTVGREYSLRVEAAGTYHVEMRSLDFDTYLVLFEGDGTTPIAEDDDGWYAVHSRLVVELDPDTTYRLVACALHGDRGSYTLSFDRGAPEPLDGVGREALRERDLRALGHRAQALLQAAANPRDEECEALGAALIRSGRRFTENYNRPEDALPLLERALELCAQRLGETHVLTGRAHRVLGQALSDAGRPADALELLMRAVDIANLPTRRGSLEEAEALLALGTVLTKLSEYGFAREVLERSVARHEALTGKESLLTAWALDRLAEATRHMGDLEESRDLLERALAIRQQALGEEHLETTRTLHHLAHALWMDDPPRTRSMLEGVLRARERTSGPDSLEVATICYSLADLLLVMESFAEARRHAERALTIIESERGPDARETGMTLVKLAEALSLSGHPREARPMAERALVVARERSGEHTNDTLEALAVMRSIHVGLGEFDEALRRAEEAVALSERLFGPSGGETALHLTSLGFVHWWRGELATAREHLERALAIRERLHGHTHEQTLRVRKGLAYFQVATGDAPEGLKELGRVVSDLEAIFGVDHPHLVDPLVQLAEACSWDGDDETARTHFERALALVENGGGGQEPALARIHRGLARIHSRSNDPEAASAHSLRDLAITRRLWEPLHPRVIAALYEAGLNALRDNRLQQSLAHLEEALELAATLPAGHPLLARVVITRAQALLEVGGADEAWRLLASRREDRRLAQQRALLALTESECFARLADTFWELSLVLAVASRAEVDGVASETYDEILAWKGQVTRAQVASRERVYASRSPGSRDQVDRLNAVQRRIGTLTGPARPDPSLVVSLEALLEERNALEVSLLRSVREAGDFTPADTARLRAALPRDAALVDMLVAPSREPGEHSRRRRDDERVTAWVVKADLEDPVRVDLGRAVDIEGALDAAVDDMRTLRGSSLVPVDMGASSARLREQVWEPLEELLEGVHTVFLCPDGVMTRVPFAALTLEDGSFALEHHRFVRLPDASWLLRPEPRAGASLDSLLAVGAVSYGSPVDGGDAGSAARWASLPATRAEVEALVALHAQAFPESGARTSLVGGEAGEARVVGAMPEHSIVHLATHGYFTVDGSPSLWTAARRARAPTGPEPDPDRRLEGRHPGLSSGLVLAGANGPAPDGADADGYLTASEVAWLDLEHAELAVLSACETGLGRAQAGEGLLGLTRAFHVAGADTVVSSLWSVGDEGTRDLMERFYQRLLESGEARVDALRSAQLEVLEHNREAHGNGLPSTWGAFVLSGEWR